MNIGSVLKVALSSVGISPIISLAMGAFANSDNAVLKTAHKALANVKQDLDSGQITGAEKLAMEKQATKRLAIEGKTNVALSQSVNTSMQAESVSKSLMQCIWRPLFGVVVSVCFGATVISTLVLTFYNPEKATSLINAVGSLMPLWVSAFGVLGVYTHGRTKEKMGAKNNG